MPALYGGDIQRAMEAAIWAVAGPLPRTTAAYGLITAIPPPADVWVIADLALPVAGGLQGPLLGNVPATPSTGPGGSLQRAFTTIVGWENDDSTPETIAGVYLTSEDLDTDCYVIVPFPTPISVLPGAFLYLTVTFAVSPAGVVTVAIAVT